MEENQLKKVVLRIPFENKWNIEIAYKVLEVDADLKGGGTQKTLCIEDNKLVVKFEGNDYKKLRVAVNGFLKKLSLVVKTISLFGSTSEQLKDA